MKEITILGEWQKHNPEDGMPCNPRQNVQIELDNGDLGGEGWPANGYYWGKFGDSTIVKWREVFHVDKHDLVKMINTLRTISTGFEKTGINSSATVTKSKMKTLAQEALDVLSK